MKSKSKNLFSKIKNIRTLWGIELDFQNTKNLNQQIEAIKANFDGVEIATGFFDEKYKLDFIKMLKEFDLKIITQIHTNGYPVKSNNINVHLDDFKYKLENSLTWDPVLINSHSGTDYWTLEENIEFFNKANEISENSLKSSNIELFHETHRQRILFNPFTSYQIINKIPNLKLNLDLSHWIVTSERLLNEENDFYWNSLEKILIDNTGLIHARIGTINSIQVVDPIYYKEYEDYYFNIWKKIIENSKRDIIYVDYEYGPYPYLFINPLNNKPIKDLNQVIIEQRKKFEDYMMV